MGCPSKSYLGENFDFSIVTHDPATAGRVDADSLPTYEIYEEGSESSMLSGTMPKKDDTNTTGYYVKTIAGTTANGFESGKSYDIHIEAIVNGVTAGISYTIKIETPIWEVASRTLTTSSTPPDTGLSSSTWRVIRGDTEERTFSDIAADGSITKVIFSVKKKLYLTNAQAMLVVDSATGLLYLNGAAPDPAYTATFTLPAGVLTLPAITMTQVVPGMYEYDVQVWRGSTVQTIELGRFIIKGDVSTGV
jgi:hypothetical protein